MSWSDGLPEGSDKSTPTGPLDATSTAATPAAASTASTNGGYSYGDSYESPLASYTKKAGYNQEYGGYTRDAMATMDVGPGDGQVSVVDYLKSASFEELLVAVRCGKLDSVKCLCDPYMREAAKTLDLRFSRRELAALFSTLCGCSVPAKPPTKVSLPPDTVVTKFPPDTPTPPVVVTKPACPPPGIPEKGTWS